MKLRTKSLKIILPLLALFSVLTFGLIDTYAAASSGISNHADRYPFSVVKIIGDDPNLPRLLLKDNNTSDNMYITVPPAAVVTVNGEPSGFQNLNENDQVKLVLNEIGATRSIEARRTISGIVTDTDGLQLTVTPDYIRKSTFAIKKDTKLQSRNQNLASSELHPGDRVTIVPGRENKAIKIDVEHENPLIKFWNNFKKNLFKPLLLFFYLGFLTVILRVPFEFPQPIYQGLTIYLLLAIGWHGGEELACLSPGSLGLAAGFMVVGFCTNLLIGFLAYFILRRTVPQMRKIDTSTVAAYYGSDSAGTFVTCLGVLQSAAISFAAYMPVMLAVMEIPGCLVGLYLASRLRRRGMDKAGNMPDEDGYKPPTEEEAKEIEALGKAGTSHKGTKIIREMLLNPGLFLLIGGIVVGFVSRLQGPGVTEPDDTLFISLFQGMLCLFLLEMGMNAAKRIRDLKYAGSKFVLFGLLAPNIFALIGILITNGFSHFTATPFHLGTYALFAVLCASASYIAVPAIQRLAIPEASPTLPLAASLGLTFTYNVTIGIPLYMAISEVVIRLLPVG